MPSMFARSNSSSSKPLVSDTALQVLGPVVSRALADKVHETKKKGGKEIEDVIRFVQERDVGVAREKTTAIINTLTHEFLSHSNKELKVGGLIGLVGAARGLQDNTKYYLAQIVLPVIKFFHDSDDVNLRYYAAECLFNLCLLAPSDVVVFLDDLVEISFKMWSDASPHLVKSAEQYVDPTLRQLADTHASATQLESLMKAVVKELSRHSQAAPMYLLPWLQLLIQKANVAGYEVPVVPLLRGVLALGQRHSSAELQTLTRDLAVLTKQEPMLLSDASLITDLRAVVGGTHAQNLVFHFIFSLLGISDALPRALELQTVDLSENTMVTVVAPVLVQLILELLAANCANVDLLADINTQVSTTVCADPRQADILSRIAKIVVGAIEQSSNHLVAEFCLHWLTVLPSLEFSPQVLSLIVGLVCHERPKVHRMAQDCIQSLCKDEKIRVDLLSGSLQRAASIKSLSQAQSFLGLLDCLLGNWPAENSIVILGNALMALPRPTFENMINAYFAAFLSLYAIVEGERCRVQAWWLALKPEVLKSYEQFPLVHIVLSSLTQGVQLPDVVQFAEWTFRSSNCCRWWPRMAEVLIYFLELPAFTRARTLTDPTVYRFLERQLPLHSRAFFVASRRAGLSVLRYTDLRNLVDQFRVENDCPQRLEESQDSDIFAGFDAVLIPLLQGHKIAAAERPVGETSPQKTAWMVQSTTATTVVEDGVICQAEDTPTFSQTTAMNVEDRNVDAKDRQSASSTQPNSPV